MKKLKYTELVRLIKDGKENEIPKEYKITWREGRPPHTLFKEEVTKKENITITGNDLPVPTRAIISGGFEPLDMFDFYSNFKPLEFGEVIISTVFVLNEVIFEYEPADLKDNSRKLMEFIRKGSEAVTGRRVNKADICFDVKLQTSLGEINLKSALFSDINFNLGEDEGAETVIVKIRYDFATIDFNY